MTSQDRKVAVITGASAPGIGASAAIEFAKEGYKLVLHASDEAKLKEVIDKCVQFGLKRENVATVSGDLTKEDTINTIVKTTLDKFGTIHVLFFYGGYKSKQEGPITAGKVEALDEMYQINMRVPYLLCQKFIPELTKNKGAIILCSAVLSWIVNPNMTAYSATKAGLDHMTRLMAMALAKDGVRVNAINPGYAVTPQQATKDFYKEQASFTPLENKLCTPEEVANVVVWLASEKASSITGETVLCDRAVALAHPMVDRTRLA